jgi:hypothetical protein
VTEVVRSLVALCAELDVPGEPDLLPGVRARLAHPAPRRPSRRRVLAVALAVLAVAVGLAFAVPPARTAILDFLGFGGVTIERVPEQPVAPARGLSLGLGPRVSLAEARRKASFRVLVPSLLGAPREVYFTAALPGGQVGLIWFTGDPERPTILLTELRAGGLEFARKAASPDTTVRALVVNGGRGFWLSGSPHSLVFVAADGTVREDSLRLAGNVLLWKRGDVTLRLEGVRSLRRALEIARTVG